VGLAIAHGFLTWALATLVTASLMATAIGAIFSGGVQAGATVAGGAANGLIAGATAAASGDAGDSISYYVDSLFRPVGEGAGEGSQTMRSAEQDTAEARGIFAHVVGTAALSPDDTRHLGQLIVRPCDPSCC
jgi:hypothetical protein